MTESQSEDELISSFLSKYNGQEWAKKIVLGSSACKNPFFSPAANRFSLLPWFDSNQIVEIFNDDVNKLECKSTRNPDFSNSSSRVLNFLTDTDSKSIIEKEKMPKSLSSSSIESISEEVEKTPKLIAESVLFGNHKEITSHSVDLSAVLEAKTASYIQISLSDFKIRQPLFEPIFLVAQLHDGAHFVSELWTIVPEQSKELFNDKGIEVFPRTRADFRLLVEIQQLYLVIAFYHPYTHKMGADCITAYTKGDKALPQAKKSLEKAEESDISVFSPFAYLVTPLEELISDEELPPPTLCTECITCDFISKIIQEPNSAAKENKLGISIAMKAFVKEIDDKSEFADGMLIGNMQMSIKEPILNFRHQLVVVMNKVSLSSLPFWFTDAIFFTVSFKNGLENDPIPIIKDRISSENKLIGKSICVQANKETAFDDTFVIDLPLNFESNATLIFDFYGVATKKGKLEKVKIGTALLQLVEEGSSILSGIYDLTISEDANKDSNAKNSSKASTCQVTIMKRSLIIPECKELADIYNDFNNDVFDIDNVKKCKESILMRSSLSIIEILIRKFAEHPHEIMNILLFLSEVSQTNCQQNFEKFLDIFSVYFAFTKKETINPSFHKELIKEWTNIITEDIKEKRITERRDYYLCNFFFVLIIKSICLTEDKGCTSEFNAFIGKFTGSIFLLNHENHEKALHLLNIFSVFCIMLFDVGHYSTAIRAIEIQVLALQETKEDWEAAIFFLENTITPKVLAGSLLFSDHMKNFFIECVKKCLLYPDIEVIRNIFRIFNYNIRFMPCDIQKEVSNTLIETIHSFPDLINHESIEVTDQLMATFCFVIGSCDKEVFNKCFDNVEDKDNFFKAVNKLVDFFSYGGKAVDNENRFSLKIYTNEKREEEKEESTKTEEEAFSCQNSVLSMIEHIIDKEEYATYIYFLFYHILSTNLETTLIDRAITLFTNFVSLHGKFVFQFQKIALPKFIIKILELSILSKESSSNFFCTLYKVDMEEYGNNNRSDCIVQRAVSLMREDVVLSISLQQTPIDKFISDYANVIRELNNAPDVVENKAELLFRKCQVFDKSPDAQIEILQELAEFQKKNNYTLEEVQIRFTQEAIVIEFLSFIGRIKSEVFGRLHAGEVFLSFAPSVSNFFMKDEIIKDIPVTPSFCDSQLFGLPSLANHVMESLNICKDYNLHEYVIALTDVIIPLMEQSYDFSLLSISCSRISESSGLLSEIPPKDDRLLGMYYRVAFYGSIFGKDNGKTFIYRERNLTNVYTFSERMKKNYEASHPGKLVEIIKESGAVDPNSLNKWNDYIQITSVDPFIRKKELAGRKSQFEKKTLITSFSFNTPFIKGSSKAQGSVSEQWHRRSIFTVDNPIPWILQRQEVRPENMKVIEYDPCTVSCRMLRSRIDQMKEATALKSYSILQGLLNGSLIASVNGGPVQIADAFLKDIDPATDDSKPRNKLRAIFKEFITVNAAGLKVHADYAAENPLYMNLQHELENGLSFITEELSKYI